MSSPPTSFLALVFETVSAAQDALSTVRELDGEHDVSVRDAVVVLHTESGRIELEQTRQIAAGEAVVSGGSAALVAGLLLGVPIVGAAVVGIAGGALFGLRDTGIPDDRMRKLGADLRPGQAVLCVLVDMDGVGRTRETLGRYGTVFEVALSSEPGSEPGSSSGSDSGSP